MKLNTNISYNDFMKISENLKYHIKEHVSISECVFRLGSDAYCDFINEIRNLYTDNKIILNDNDKFIIENLKTGTKAIYKPRGGKEKSVVLDTPAKGGRKKFYVYRDSGKKDNDGNIIAKIIEWGDPNMTVKNCDEGARKSFLARHKCSEKTLEKDGMKAGWWACNVHRFAKQLSLECDKPW